MVLFSMKTVFVMQDTIRQSEHSFVFMILFKKASRQKSQLLQVQLRSLVPITIATIPDSIFRELPQISFNFYT
ncbi:MAG: hypothetical protein EBR82_24785 [Caulobacteraceae bacterium]|nr:hypothetical protein [Caulobacteraceae bacterium]